MSDNEMKSEYNTCTNAAAASACLGFFFLHIWIFDYYSIFVIKTYTCRGCQRLSVVACVFRRTRVRALLDDEIIHYQSIIIIVIHIIM